MTKFLKSILLFLIPLLLVNIAFYAITNRLYMQPYLEHGDLNNYRTFIFADSHGPPLGNFFPHDKIYNFSAASDSYQDMRRKLMYLIRNTNVDRIILTADDHTLSSYRENASNSDRSMQFISYDDFKALDKSANWLSFAKEKYITHYIVLLNPKSKGILWSYFKSLVRPADANGEAFWNKRHNKEKFASNRVKVQFPNNSKSMELVDDLLGIIDLCKKHNIELMGIKFPLSKDYLDALGNKSFGADSILQSQNIQVLDFRNSFIHQDSLFANQDHLNSIGGEILSQKIVEILN